MVVSSDVVKDPEPAQNVTPAKPETSTTKPPDNQATPSVSTDPPEDPGPPKSPVTTTIQSKPRKEVEELKEFSVNFQVKFSFIIGQWWLTL